MRTTALVAAFFGYGLLLGCTSSPASSDAGADAAIADAAIADAATADAPLDNGGPDASPRDGGGSPNIDLLFLVDNSGSMGEEQAALAVSFPAFVNALAASDGGLPNLHIGVISSNVGAGGFNISGCGGDGDNGALQSSARVAGCTSPTGRFIVDSDDGSGGRVRNYPDGQLSETFACIAQLGTGGCGFEQHLESMKRALDGTQPANNDFLRRDAALVVVIVADEDDCSARNSALFDPFDTSLTGTLGPLASFRCTEFGVTCDQGNLTRASASYTGCVPRIDSPYIRAPSEYASFLRGLKDDPSLIFTFAVVGNPEPVRVKINDHGEPQLEPSCSDPAGVSGVAYPAVRFRAFLQEFPDRSAMVSICTQPLSQAFEDLAVKLRETLDST